jgi:hypothetical protein
MQGVVTEKKALRQIINFYEEKYSDKKLKKLLTKPASLFILIKLQRIIPYFLAVVCVVSVVFSWVK